MPKHITQCGRLECYIGVVSDTGKDASMTEPKRKPTYAKPSLRVRADRALKSSLTTRIADDELAIIQEAAAAANVTVSAYLRAAALGTASMPPAEQHDILYAAGVAV